MMRRPRIAGTDSWGFLRTGYYVLLFLGLPPLENCILSRIRGFTDLSCRGYTVMPDAMRVKGEHGPGKAAKTGALCKKP